MDTKKFIPLSDIEITPSQDDLHKYTSFIAKPKTTYDDIMEVVPKKKCKISESEKSDSDLDSDFFNKEFLCHCVSKPLPKKCKTRKIRQRRPAFLAKLKNFEDFREETMAKALKHFEDVIKSRRTPHQLKENTCARDYLSYSKKKQLKHEAITETPTKPSAIDISSFVEEEEDMQQKKKKQKKFRKKEEKKLSEKEKVLVQDTTPTGSTESMLVQAPKILDMKKIPSRIFINNTPFSNGKDLPFQNYNPRELERILGYGPYEIKAFDNRMYVKVKDDEIMERIPKGYKPNSALIYAAKTFDIPDEDYIKKGIMLHQIRGSKATESEKYCPKLNRRPKPMATIYAAYATFLTKHPDNWDENVIDRIIDEGGDHWRRCEKVKYINPKGNFDILENIVDKEVQIRIRMVLKHMIDKAPNLLKVLTLVLDCYSHIVFQHKDLYLLIIKKNENVFCIFDPNGRTCNMNREVDCGRAALISLRSIEGIIEFIFYTSWREYPRKYLDEPYRIFSIGIVDKKFESKEYVGPFPYKPKKRFSIINKYYAFIPATIGIEQPKYSWDENSSILISLMALIYAGIEDPKYWTPKTVNGLINYGGQYYYTLMKAERLESIHVNQLPKLVVIGAYTVIVNIFPYYETGFIERDESNYRRSSFRSALLKFFKKYNQAILQIDNTCLAIWKNDKFFFVLDPFERQKNGLVIKVDQEENLRGGGGLQIHVNFDSMCRILYLNATDVAIVGYFYLHGYNFGELQYQRLGIMTGNKYVRPSACKNTGQNYYENLKIFYPNMKMPRKKTKESSKSAKVTVTAPKIEVTVPLECLSVLSVSPCQRTSSESEFILKEMAKAEASALGGDAANQMEKVLSIQSILDEERVRDPDVEIVTELVIHDILAEIDKEINYCEERRHFMGVRAKAVLLQSDINHLNETLERIRTGQYEGDDKAEFLSLDSYDSDNFIEKTNFQTTLDGVGIIIGSEKLYCGTTEEEYRLMLLQGVTNAYSSLICAAKYKISTWNIDIINIVIKIGSKIHKSFEAGSDIVHALVKNNFPDVEFGRHIMNTSVQMIGVFQIDRLLLVLQKSLPFYDKLMLLFGTFNCAVIKRRKHFYLFFGIPCDELGFRSTKSCGNACLLRYDDLKALVDRIIYDRNEDKLEKFILINVFSQKNQKENCDEDVKVMSARRQEYLLKKEMEMKKKREEALADKIKATNELRLKEKQRINDFQVLKTIACAKQKKKSNICMMCPVDYNDLKEIKKPPPKKHPQFISQDKEEPTTDKLDEKQGKTEIGFVECDGRFAVQGKKYLSNRSEADINAIKACHFAAIYAILQSTAKPIHKWYPSIIDDIIDKSKQLFERVENKSVRRTRVITNLEFDDFISDIRIVLTNRKTDNSVHIDKQLGEILKERQYFMLQIENTTFAVYFDKFFYLFDSYSSSEKLKKNKKNCKIGKKGGKYKGKNNDKNMQKNETESELKISKIKCQRNGAAWFVFPNVNEFKNYICNVSTDKQWYRRYCIYYIDILKCVQNKRNANLGDFMKHPFIPGTLNSKSPSDINDWCHLKGEQLTLVSPGIPTWSRVNKFNPKLNTLNNKLVKAFDVQIPDELYSLFGSIHPNAPIFKKSRTKQFLAINVLACCIAHLYQVTEWNSYLLDTIVINGDRYFNESIKDIENSDLEMEIEYLNPTFLLNEYKFLINIEKSCYGAFFLKDSNLQFNLTKALMYFFRNKNCYGILTIRGNSIAFGLANKGYFMYDCQSYGRPLFETDQGASYCLLCDTLYRLIYCIIVTLNVRKNIEFIIYNIKIKIEKNDGTKIEQNKKKIEKKSRKCKKK